MPGLAVAEHGNRPLMLRKALWSGLYAGFGAVSSLVAYRFASTVWRAATGDEPPGEQ